MQTRVDACELWSNLDGFSAGLSSWEFLQDLEVVSDPSADNVLSPHEPMASSSSARLKEKNRLAQKRARQKKKERSVTMEAQLFETTSQLHELKLRQKQLEARNNLLEKVAVLNTQLSIQLPDDQSDSQAQARETVLGFLEKYGLQRTQSGAVVLTVLESPQEMKVEDVSTAHLTEYAKLYSAYVRKQAQCLLDIQGGRSDKHHDSLSHLRRWSLEAAALAVCFCSSGHHAVDVLHSLNMQDGTLFRDPLPETAHVELLAALEYTDSQQQDALHLRRMFCGKLGQLARDRASIMSQMSGACQLSHPQPVTLDFKHTAARIAETKDYAAKLCANRAEERQAFIYCAVCFLCCIQTRIQYAVAMVDQYPRAANSKILLEVIAQQHNEPSRDSLMEPSGQDDFQHAANWDAVIQYVDSFDANGVSGQNLLVK